jgi:tRNA pseudouridine55 synthase
MIQQKGEVILVNKPYRWTSFDVVSKLRGLTKMKKVGHSGTLDPLATGLLVICTGTYTRTIDLIQAKEKEYFGSLVLGATTPSYDLEMEINNTFPTDHITESMILENCEKFRGKIQQIAPAHSAKKINGKRAYELAREGKEVVIQPREVEIMEFEIIGIELPRVDFRVVCSKGTYIRSLADDFGRTLGSGAYLSALMRSRIGEYKIEDALSIDELILRYKSDSESATKPQITP